MLSVMIKLEILVKINPQKFVGYLLRAVSG
jgi:hypothetical protein